MNAATGQFSRTQCEKVYQESLKPIFAGHPQEPSLDDRNVFYLEMLARHGALQSGKHLVDLGAGLSVFGPMARKLGMEVTLIDDFGGGGGVLYGQRLEDIKVLDLFRDRLGIKIVTENFLESPLPLADASVDVITCFHSLEHWHHSPKQALSRNLPRHPAAGLPGAGHAERSEHPQTRFMFSPGAAISHCCATGMTRAIRFIAGTFASRSSAISSKSWNGTISAVVGTYGRNFIGRRSKVLASLPEPLVNAAAIVSEKLLRFFPSLCSDIHVIGRKRT